MIEREKDRDEVISLVEGREGSVGGTVVLEPLSDRVGPTSDTFSDPRRTPDSQTTAVPGLAGGWFACVGLSVQPCGDVRGARMLLQTTPLARSSAISSSGYPSSARTSSVCCPR